MPSRAEIVELSADERLVEVAAILARGVLRLRRRTALPPAVGKKPPEKSAPAGLEVSGETVLSVHTS